MSDRDDSEDFQSPESERSVRRERARARRQAREARASSGEDASAAPGKRRGYEFSADHNRVFGVLSTNMTIVAVLGLVGLAISAVAAFRVFVQVSRLPEPLAPPIWPWLVVAAALVAGLFTAMWTLQAARAFKAIVDTRGEDVDYLMRALRELGKVYLLQVIFAALALAVLALEILMGMGGPSTG